MKGHKAIKMGDNLSWFQRQDLDTQYKHIKKVLKSIDEGIFKDIEGRLMNLQPHWLRILGDYLVMLNLTQKGDINGIQDIMDGLEKDLNIN